MSNEINGVLLHGKVDGILKEFLIINPVNLVINKAEVPGDLKAADGVTPLMVTRTLVNFQNGMQLIVQETPKEVLSILRGETEQVEVG